MAAAGRWRVSTRIVLLFVLALLVWYMFEVARARLTAAVLLRAGNALVSIAMLIAAALWARPSIVRRRATARSRGAPSAPDRDLSSRRAVASVVVFPERGAPRRVELPVGETLVGTGPGCGVRLGESGVAPRSLVIRAHGDGTAEVRALVGGDRATLDGSSVESDWLPFRHRATLAVGGVRIELAE